MRALPGAVREVIDPTWGRFRVNGRAWLTQLYYDRPEIHYEVWNLGEGRGGHPGGSLEIGLHFESRDRDLNTALLTGFQGYLGYIKHTLGERWEADLWDRGWTKVYTTTPRGGLTHDDLARVAQELATAMGVLQPVLAVVVAQIGQAQRTGSAAVSQ